jgi:hypothetical protein
MTPWFDAGTARSFSYLSLLSLVGVLQIFVNRGRYRAAVTAALAAGAVLGATLLVLTAVATLAGQPHHVVFAFGVAGAVLGVVFGSVLLSLRGQYAKAELRRIAAKDI